MCRAVTVDGVYMSRRLFFFLLFFTCDLFVWVENGLIPALKVIFCSSKSAVFGWSVRGLFLSVSLIPVPSDFTGVNGDCIFALLTANGAAPGKLAGASLHHLGPARSVSRPAAHQLASVWRQSRGSCFTKDRFVVDLRVGFSFSPLRSTLPLHLLPAVPGIPFSGSRWQKSGEGAR